MFTGIIEAIGSIRAMTPKGGDVRVYVATGKLDLGDVKLGDKAAEPKASGLTESFLAEHGYLKN